jgi:phosphatidylinositol transfer protein SFH5
VIENKLETHPATVEPSVGQAAPSTAAEGPQNELTKKFTESEWEGVKALRVSRVSISWKPNCLPPDVSLSQNYLKLRKKCTKIRVNISPSGALNCLQQIPVRSRAWFSLNSCAPGAFLNLSTSRCSPGCRGGDLKAAETMLISTLKWRHEFKVDELKTETFPEDVFGKVGVISGRDKGGRPVTYNFYGSVDPNVVFKDVDQFIRWVIMILHEGACAILMSKYELAS